MIRRTPLARSQKPLKRTPLKRVSKKHAKELRTYAKLRKAFLATHPMCELARYPGCTGYASEVHHTKKRGKYLNDPQHFLATCTACHRWCHENASLSRHLGFLQ